MVMPQPTELETRLQEWQVKGQKFSTLAGENQRKIEDIQKQISAIQAQPIPILRQFPKYKQPGGLLGKWIQFGEAITPGSTIALANQIRPFQEQVVQLGDEQIKADFYARLYWQAPAVIASGVAMTRDDILSKLKMPDMTPDEQANVNQEIDNMLSIIQVREQLPEMAEGVEVELPELQPPQPKPIATSLQIITVDAIKKSLQAPRIPEQVMSDAEWQAYLANSGQQLGQAEQLTVEANDIIKEWQDRDNQIQAYKAGISKIPQFTIIDNLKELVMSPGLSMIKLVGLYSEKVSAPLAGALYKTFIPDIQASYEKLRRTEDTWQALAHAWEEYDANWALKYLLMEGLTDPLMYVGWGIPAKITKAMGLTKLSRGLGAAEYGMMSVMDAPFDFIKWLNKAKWSPEAARGILKPLVGQDVIPKTFAQRAMVAQHQAGQFVQKALTGYTHKYMNQVTMKDWDKFAKASINFWRRHPQSEDIMVVAARELVAHKPLDEAAVKDWAKRLSSSLTPEQISRQTVEAVNGIFEDFFMSRTVGLKESSSRLVQVLSGGDVLDKAVRLLDNHSSRIVDSAYAFRNYKSPYKAMQQLMDRNFKITKASLDSQDALARREMGRVSSGLLGVADDIQRVWTKYIDKMLISPLARSYLVFGLYGPMNAVEDIIRTSLGGVRPGLRDRDAFSRELIGLAYDPELNIPGISEQFGYMRAGAQDFSKNNWILTLSTLPLSLPTYALSAGKITPTKFARTASDILTGLPGAFAMDMRRNFVASRYKQILAMNGGEQVEKLLSTMAKFTGTTNKKINREVTQAMMGAVMTGDTKAIRELKQVFTRSKIRQGEVNGILLKHPELSNQTRQYVMDAANDGSLFAEAQASVERIIKESYDMEMQAYLRGPELAGKQYEELVKVLSEMPLNNPEQLAQVIIGLNRMSELYGATPKQILSQAVKYTRGMDFETRNTTINQVLDTISDFNSKTGSQIDLLMQNVRNQLVGTGTTPEYMMASERLFDAQVAKRVRLTQLHEDMNSWRREYFTGATRDDLHSEYFWNQFYAELDEHIHKVNVAATEFDGQIDGILGELDNIGGIKFERSGIDASGRSITNQDVANIVGARVDDLSSTLLSAMVAQNDKDMFIAYVMGKVRAGDKGITKEGVGQVYDRLVHEVGRSPEQMSWMAQKEAQLGSVRDELHQLYNSKLLPDNEVEAIGKYVDEVAGKVESITTTTSTNVLPSTREYWDTNLEHNSLRTMRGGQDTNAGAFLSNHIEGVGDILRESAKSIPDSGYIFEKFNRIKNNIRSRDWRDTLSEVELGKLAEVKSLIKNLPTTNPLEHDIKAMLDYITNRNVKGIEDFLPTFRKRLEDIKPVEKSVHPEFANYQTLRQQALDEAQKWYYKEYVDYSHANMFDAIMKSIYPFWTYESQRLFWLPRSFVQHPGTMTALGRYMDNSDNGYIHIPNTSVDINPFRGTVYGTVTTRLSRQDFPEYYDNLPFAGGLIGFNDWLSRYGFYASGLFTVPLALIGGREAQFGEVLPAMAKTTLDVMVATFPKSENIKAISNAMFGDRFRKYLTLKIANQNGANGTLIYAKMQEKQALTDEEQAAWDNALSQASWYSAGFEQFGLFRLRPEEQNQIYEKATKAIEELFGITPEEQDILRSKGISLWDVVGGLSYQEQDILKELGYYKYVGGSRPLLPGKQQEVLNRIELAWDDVNRYSDNVMDNKLQLQRQFMAGQVSPSDYVGGLLNIYNDQRSYIDNKVKENPLMDINNRAEYYKEFNLAQPVMHPIKELAALYFNVKLQDTVDPETGEIMKDWDTFWSERAAIEQAIPEQYKQEWQDFLSKNSTRLEELRREVSSKYFRKYNQLYDTVIGRYSEDEQNIINEYLYLKKMGQNLSRQEEIKSIQAKDGRQLVSAFQADVGNARKALRFANPTLDAWLMYWGRISSLLTPQAQQIFEQIKRDTGRKS